MNRYQNDNEHNAVQTVKLKIGAFNFYHFFLEPSSPLPLKASTKIEIMILPIHENVRNIKNNYYII